MEGTATADNDDNDAKDAKDDKDDKDDKDAKDAKEVWICLNQEGTAAPGRHLRAPSVRQILITPLIANPNNFFFFKHF